MKIPKINIKNKFTIKEKIYIVLAVIMTIISVFMTLDYYDKNDSSMDNNSDSIFEYNEDGIYEN